ncbi:LysM domain-containing protein [Colletotrichum kahawae]|uniref:LysM domain-containing protein n=1 Tax=Colletotrichum kahawae TaxID=34407 RepID=A0AAD9YPV9_COLKA|nr:LysM domain-containing protein [Colletotrichum kahawae]
MATIFVHLKTNVICDRNTTLNCDSDLFQWTSKVDNIYWTSDNTTQLCTTGCLDSSRQWKEDVAGSCEGEFLRSGDQLVEADTLSTRFAEGLEIACLQPSADEWCFVESQEWVGSDVVRPDCAANPSDPWCINPANVTAENSRMANLYEDDLLCSECFLKLMHARISSEFLPDEDHSDYLVEQFQDIQDVCQTTIAAQVMTRSLPNYPTVLTPTPTFGEGPATVTDTEPEETELSCAEGQVVINVMGTYSNDSFQACNDISLQYGVATGSLLVATGNEACYVEAREVCGPQPCQLLRVHDGQTCESIASAISNATDPVNGAQLATWNPNILGACDHLVQDQYICVTRPGGSWIPPAIDSLPDDSQGPVRGGPGSTPTLEIIDNPTTPIDPWLLQEGIVEGCTRYVLASSGANCWKIANDAAIEQSRLFELNPVLGSEGELCDTMVWKDYYYCVGVNGEGSPPVTTTRTSAPATSTTASVPKPTNTQAGQPSDCNKWAEATAGAGCWSMYTDAGITAEQFYKWNPVLGAAGENCGTQIWPEYFYCIGIGSSSSPPPVTTTTTAGNDPAKPTATHAGTASDCTQFVQAKAGDGCWSLYTNAGITAELFYKLNPIFGSAGENCGSYPWPEYYYCVASSSSGDSSPPPTTTASAPKPTATQAGIAANCNKFVQAVSGDGCWKLANDAGIDSALFYQWNPVLGAAGENCGTQIWPDYYYCVGVSS